MEGQIGGIHGAAQVRVTGKIRTSFAQVFISSDRQPFVNIEKIYFAVLIQVQRWIHILPSDFADQDIDVWHPEHSVIVKVRVDSWRWNTQGKVYDRINQCESFTR